MLFLKTGSLGNCLFVLSWIYCHFQQYNSVIRKEDKIRRVDMRWQPQLQCRAKVLLAPKGTGSNSEWIKDLD